MYQRIEDHRRNESTSSLLPPPEQECPSTTWHAPDVSRNARLDSAMTKVGSVRAPHWHCAFKPSKVLGAKSTVGWPHDPPRGARRRHHHANSLHSKSRIAREQPC